MELAISKTIDTYSRRSKNWLLTLCYLCHYIYVGYMLLDGQEEDLCKGVKDQNSTSSNCSTGGISSYVLPLSTLPVFFLLVPPHCLKKKATLFFVHCC